jgi:hypothetical protein
MTDSDLANYNALTSDGSLEYIHRLRREMEHYRKGCENLGDRLAAATRELTRLKVILQRLDLEEVQSVDPGNYLP